MFNVCIMVHAQTHFDTKKLNAEMKHIKFHLRYNKFKKLFGKE